MAQASVARAFFDDAASWAHNTAVGTFTTCVVDGGGSIYRRERGPRKTSIAAPGFSGELRTSNALNYAILSHTLTGAAQTHVFGTAQFLVNRATIVSSAPPYFLNGRDSASASYFVGINDAGNFCYSFNGAGFTDLGVAVPIGSWFWLALELENVAASNNFTAKIYLGTSTANVAQIGSTITAANANATWAAFWMGSGPSSGGTTRIRGRIGAAAIDSLGAGETPVFPTDLIDAPALGGAANTVYVNPATGSDSNSGLSAGTAIQTAAEINLRARYSGFLPGDTLFIDGSTTRLTISTAPLEFSIDGLIQDWNGIAPISWKDVSGGVVTWVLHDTNVWKTTDGSATDIASATVWENGVALAHPNGADIAAVLPTLKANAGGTGMCFGDLTTLYYVASDNSNPNTNGKTLLRSRNRTSVIGSATAGGASLITFVNCSGTVVKNLPITSAMTTLAAAANGDPVGGSVIQFDSQCSGTHYIANVQGGKWSKHFIECTSSSNGLRLECTDVDLGNGSPYTVAGGQTGISLNNDTGSGNSALFVRVTQSTNKMAIGSAGGTIDTSMPSVYSHGTSTTGFNGGVMFRNCSFCSTIINSNTMSGGTLTEIDTKRSSVDAGNASLIEMKSFSRRLGSAWINRTLRLRRV